VKIQELFYSTYGGPPQGVWSAPGRANLIGEHTDYTGGFVMPFALDFRVRIAARSRGDRLIKAVTPEHTVQEIQLDQVHLGEPTGFLGYLAGAAWVLHNEYEITHGWDFALESDIPIGAGLSSSAAISCAAILAMSEIADLNLSQTQIALAAQQVEHRVIGTPCGIMDQLASMLGEKNRIVFIDTRDLSYEQVPWNADSHDLTILVTNTNSPHVLADGQYAAKRARCEEATEIMQVEQLRDATLADLDRYQDQLSPDQQSCARHVITENARVLKTKQLLRNDQLPLIGPLISASHESLRDDFKVTVAQVDLAVDTALNNGALGARMIGGGFGGCTLALVKKADADMISEKIATAFRDHHFQAPESFVASPAAGAQRDS
jgi:galactokinase